MIVKKRVYKKTNYNAHNIKSHNIIHENASENIVCKMTAILSRGDELKQYQLHVMPNAFV